MRLDIGSHRSARLTTDTHARALERSRRVGARLLNFGGMIAAHSFSNKRRDSDYWNNRVSRRELILSKLLWRRDGTLRTPSRMLGGADDETFNRQSRFDTERTRSLLSVSNDRGYLGLSKHPKTRVSRSNKLSNVINNYTRSNASD